MEPVVIGLIIGISFVIGGVVTYCCCAVCCTIKDGNLQSTRPLPPGEDRQLLPGGSQEKDESHAVRFNVCDTIY
jgi:hypothetical protein